MTTLKKLEGAVLRRLPGYKKMEQTVRDLGVRNSELQNDVIFLKTRTTELERELQTAHKRELEVREKWIEDLARRGIFSRGDDGAPVPSAPPKRIPSRQFSQFVTSRHNRQFVRDLIKKGKEPNA